MLRNGFAKLPKTRTCCSGWLNWEDLERRVWLAMGRRNRELAPVHGLHDHSHELYQVASAIIEKHHVRNVKGELVHLRPEISETLGYSLPTMCPGTT